MTDLVFPVLAFWSGDPENEQFFKYARIEDLQAAREAQLRRGDGIGMTLVGADGKSFIVRGIRSVGYWTPAWMRALMALFGQSEEVSHRVEYDLEETSPIPFARVQKRVADSIDRNAEEWIEVDAIDEGDRSARLENALSQAKAAVTKAKTVEDLFEGLDAAWDRTTGAEGTAAAERLPGPLSFHGRAGRREFALIAMPLIAFEAAYISFLEWVWPDGPGDSAWFLPSFILLILPIALAFPAAIRRLHDLGRSALWIFVGGVAIRLAVAGLKAVGLGALENATLLVGIGAGVLYLAMARGQPHENQFGRARSSLREGAGST